MAKTVMSELVVRMTAETAELKAEMERVRRSVDTAAKNMSEEFAKSQKSVDSLAGSFKRVTVAVGLVIGAIGAVRSAASSMVDSLTKFDALAGQLTFVTKSADDAQKVLSVLTREAQKSPATVAELTDAYIKLRTRGLDASLDALKNWQNVSAAAQKSLSQWTEAVLDATTGEGERLKEFGITMRKVKDNIVLTYGDMTITVVNNAKDIEEGLMRIAKVKFTGAIEEQAGRLAQLFSNIEDAWDNLWRALGDAGVTQALKSILSWFADALNTMALGIKKLSIDAEYMWNIVKAVKDRMLSGGADFGAATLTDELNAIRAEWQQAVNALSATGDMTLPAAKGMTQLAGATGAATDGLKEHSSELEKLGVPYADLISKASKMYGVPEKVIAAVIKIESGFNASAKNMKSSATGLMQVIKGTWDWMGGDPNKRTDPWENIRVGTKYLGFLIKKYGDLDTALKHYGEGTDAYNKKFYKALESLGDGASVIDGMADAQKNAAKAAEAHEKALRKQAEAIEEINSKQQKFVQGLQDEAEAAQDALLKAQDPEGYRTLIRLREELKAQEMAAKYVEESVAAGLAEDAAKTLGDEYLKQSQKAIDAKYGAEALLEAYQVRAGWANSVLQGFDSLWSNMISGAENAMDALQKTLKSWLYAIGQWLLKQTLIIPVTAALFGVSQQSLGGGLLGQLGGAGGATGGAGGGTGVLGALSNIGNMFSGGGISQGLNRFINWATGWANAGPQQTSLFGGTNLGYGAAGLLGGFAGQKLFGGYGGMGGGIGSALGYGLGASSAVGSILGGLSWLGGPVGGILGMLAGGALGGLFGKEKIKGGVGYYDFNRRTAGAAHKDTDPAVVEMMQKLGSTMVGLDKAVRSIQGFGDMWNFGASMQLDTDSKGRMDAVYNSYSRGLQKSSFKAADDAAKWFVEQMVEDVKKQFDLHGQDMGGIGAAITNIFKGLNAEQLEAELGNLAQSLPALMTAFTGLSKPLQNEVADIARWHAKSLDDISAMMIMAGDVQKGYTTSLWEVYQVTKNLQHGGESLSQAYQRVIGQVAALQDAFLMIHGTILPVTKNTLWWGDALAKAAGGLDQLVALQSFYFENFYSDAERQVAAQKLAQVEVDKFNATLGLTGQAAIDTKEELRAYIESLDLGSKAGMEAYIAALQMAGAINTLGNAMNDAGEITYGFVNSLSAYMEKALKPSDDIGSQEQSFFENFYSDIEKQAAQVEQWKKQVADFNATLGLTGASAIDTKEDLRKYIESLDLETDAGRKAYEQAMMLVSAMLGLANALAETEEKTYGFVNSLSAYMEKTLKPGEDIGSQEQKFFENFYTDAEKQAAQIAQWKKQVDAFNATLGLTGASAIDTKDDLRRYIESLDLETDAGRKAYEQAMKLVDAILGLSGAMGGLGDSITKIKEWAENAQKVSWDEDIEPPKDFKTALDKAWDLLDLAIATGNQNYIDQLADVLDGLEQSAKQYIATLNNLNKEFQNWVEDQRSFWFKNQNEARQPPWLKGYADYDKRLKQSRYGEDWWQYGISGHVMDMAGQQRNAQQASLDYYQKALQATDPAVFAQNFQDAWDFMLKSNALGGKAMLNPADMEKMLQWAKERMNKLTEQEKEKVKEQYQQLAQAIAEAIAKVFGIEPKATLHATIDKFEPIITINIEDNREETTYTAEVD